MEMESLLTMTPPDLAATISQIGNTPLRAVYLNIDGVVRKLYLKLEGENPAGSVKDRTALALIEHLEGLGRMTRDSVVIESTSGNLGVALALICRARGYSFVAVVDPKATRENVERMRAFGGTVVEVHEEDASGGYLLTRLRYVQETCHTSSRYVWTDQYSNAANPAAHYAYTGPEIYRQMNGLVDAVFVAVSTGGTLAGIGRFFRERSPATRVIGVDAHGSVAFGGTPGPRHLTGIGSAQRSIFLTREVYDEHLLIGDGEAFTFCRALDDATGIRVGGSAGGVVAACARYLRAHREVERVVCLCADRGENYSSTIYDDRWLERQGIRASPDSLPPYVRDIAPHPAKIFA
ncbi:MAG TPA: pyridoxal-phosphate dependent enzyme [Pyrinomonadaceae bacterium]|jgi:2,3-diaminopropionate biosynthesis protein SbnA